MNNLIGQSIGRYHILDKISEDNSLVIYDALDTHRNIEILIKFIRKDQLSPTNVQTALTRFESEARNAAKVKHQNLLGILDSGQYKGEPFLVEPILQDKTLKEILKEHGVYDWKEAVQILLPITNAMAVAHENDVYHRCIRPSNILVKEDGQAYIVGFGLDRIILDLGAKDPFGENFPLDDLEYMAPEYVFNRIADKRTDVYSLGVVFFEMIKGHRPFEGNSTTDLINKIVKGPCPRLSTYPSEFPQDLESALTLMLARAPEERFQSMKVLARVLSTLVFGEQVDDQGKPEVPVEIPVVPSNEVANELPADTKKEPNPPVVIDTPIQSSANKPVAFPDLPEDDQINSNPVLPAVEHSLDSSVFPHTAYHPNDEPVREKVDEPDAFMLKPIVSEGFQEGNPPKAKKKISGFLIIGLLAIALLILIPTLGTTISNVRATQTVVARYTATQMAKIEATQTAVSRMTATAMAIQNELMILEQNAALIFGPKNGILEHNSDNGLIESKKSLQDVTDFVTQATFINPYSSDFYDWNYGFMFRHTAANYQYRLIIKSSSEWSLVLREGDDSSVVNSGTLSTLNVREGEANTIKLIARGNRGYFYLNGKLVSDLDLSQRLSNGDILIATGYVADDEKDGYFTEYENWEIRQISY